MTERFIKYARMHEDLPLFALALAILSVGAAQVTAAPWWYLAWAWTSGMAVYTGIAYHRKYRTDSQS